MGDASIKIRARNLLISKKHLLHQRCCMLLWVFVAIALRYQSLPGIRSRASSLSAIVSFKDVKWMQSFITLVIPKVIDWSKRNKKF